MWQRLLSFGNQPNEKRPSYLMIVLVIGVVFMLIGNFMKPPTQQEEVKQVVKEVENETNTDQYEERYEQQLTEALQSFLGSGNVKVVVNVDSSETKIVDKNNVTEEKSTEETAKDGSSRTVEETSTKSETIIVKTGEAESPIVLKTKKPDIRGVLIVAKNANNLQVRKLIVEAVTRVLDVPSYRVAVLPKK